MVARSGNVERFEDLIAWQRARLLAAAVYRATRERELARDFGLANQMQRSAVSIMSNIAEGFERRGLKEFARFLLMSKASCAELRSQLYVAHDVGHIDRDVFEDLMQQSDEVARIVSGLRAAVERQQHDR